MTSPDPTTLTTANGIEPAFSARQAIRVEVGLPRDAGGLVQDG